MNKILINFYKQLPFNKAKNATLRNSIHKNVPWAILNECLRDSNSVLELGCGNGWLSNRIAYNYPNLSVTGIDLIDENIKTAQTHKLPNSMFLQNDLFNDDRRADTVVSIGVLHHIEKNIVESMIDLVNRANKYCFIGLYHDVSRQALLDFFKEIPDDKKYKVFKKMTPFITDEVQRKSWFRDQFEHPYEILVSKSSFIETSKKTNTELRFTSDIDDKDLYNNTMLRLQNKEFVSGFIYGMFKK